MENDKNILISEGNRPYWQLIIAALFYTLAVVLLLMFFFGYELFPNKGINSKGDFRLIWIAISCIIQGIIFSSVKNILFDLNKKVYKEQYEVGPIKVGKWKKLPEIDYVSVFKQPKEDGNFIFETNLWYNKNKHFNIYENFDLETVYAMGINVAKVLNVDLLDAIEPNNFKWVDLNSISNSSI